MALLLLLLSCGLACFCPVEQFQQA